MSDLLSDVRSWLYMSDDVEAYAAEHDRLCKTYSSSQMLAAIRELLNERLAHDNMTAPQDQRSSMSET